MFDVAHPAKLERLSDNGLAACATSVFDPPLPTINPDGPNFVTPNSRRNMSSFASANG